MMSRLFIFVAQSICIALLVAVIAYGGLPFLPAVEHPIAFGLFLVSLPYSVVAWIFRLTSKNIALKAISDILRNESGGRSCALIAKGKNDCDRALFWDRLAPIEGLYRLVAGNVPKPISVLRQMVSELQIRNKFEETLNALRSHDYSDQERGEKISWALDVLPTLENIPLASLRTLFTYIREHLQTRKEWIAKRMEEKEQEAYTLLEAVVAYEENGSPLPHGLDDMLWRANSEAEEMRSALHKTHRALKRSLSKADNILFYSEADLRYESLSELTAALRDAIRYSA